MTGLPWYVLSRLFRSRLPHDQSCQPLASRPSKTTCCASPAWDATWGARQPKGATNSPAVPKTLGGEAMRLLTQHIVARLHGLGGPLGVQAVGQRHVRHRDLGLSSCQKLRELECALQAATLIRPAAGTQLEVVAATIAPRWPKAADLLRAAEDDVLAHMSFPVEHWTRVYATNPLERKNKEIKRRTHVVGIFPDVAGVEPPRGLYLA